MYPTCENVDLALKRAEAIVENLITGPLREILPDGSAYDPGLSRPRT